MSSATAVATEQKTANLFALRSFSGKTQITYYPSAPAPMNIGASLKYDGPEGKWHFDAAQITYEDTSLGRLISVVLRPSAGASASTFWIILPPIVVVDDDFQSFTTHGVKNGGSIQRPGKQIGYDVECFFGEAKAV